MFQLQAPSGGENKFPARAHQESGEAVPLPPPSGQSSPTATGQRDVRPAGALPPLGPSRPAGHDISPGSQASLGPPGADSHSPPALEAAANSWPPSSSSLSPRFPTARVRNHGSARYHSSGAAPRRTRSSGSATPGPDLDAILRRRRRENRKKGKGAKAKFKKSDSVILISTSYFCFQTLSLMARFSSLIDYSVRKAGSVFSVLLSLNNRPFC